VAELEILSCGGDIQRMYNIENINLFHQSIYIHITTFLITF